MTDHPTPIQVDRFSGFRWGPASGHTGQLRRESGSEGTSIQLGDIDHILHGHRSIDPFEPIDEDGQRQTLLPLHYGMLWDYRLFNRCSQRRCWTPCCSILPWRTGVGSCKLVGVCMNKVSYTDGICD